MLRIKCCKIFAHIIFFGAALASARLIGSISSPCLGTAMRTKECVDLLPPSWMTPAKMLVCANTYGKRNEDMF